MPLVDKLLGFEGRGRQSPLESHDAAAHIVIGSEATCSLKTIFQRPLHVHPLPSLDGGLQSVEMHVHSGIADDEINFGAGSKGGRVIVGLNGVGEFRMSPRGFRGIDTGVQRGGNLVVGFALG